MKRFFFDYTTRNETLLDYGGQEFRSAQGALQFAEEIALSLKNSMSNSWTGWTVEVRNPEGKRFYSLPVEGEGLSAA
jgi:hypothetical protein